ncbi:Alkyl hydroperoxide reductase subunit C [Raoultella terrigena]|uniref:Alkyl hydroperoxide reductase subunit C n=1 Tax=Raoultella terrigena TaxID=577 RepID=A0A3P8J3Y4_RAOTE|nr:Alkyl hydroperoxide reductase subunit C [Raoultella terrigena]
MSLINTKIKPFKNQAFKNGEFIEVTEKDTGRPLERVLLLSG